MPRPRSAPRLVDRPEYWLRLQDQYLLAEHVKNKTTQGKLEEVRRRALLNSKAPIQLLRKRNLLVGNNLDEPEAEVMELFELSSMEAEPAFAAAARRGNHGEEISILQRAWVACVRRTARAASSEELLGDRSGSLARSLSRTLKTSDAFSDLPKLFAEVGVRLVHVEMLPGGKIDGSPCMTERLSRYRTLRGGGSGSIRSCSRILHEVAHILGGDVDAERMIAEEFDDKRDHESAQEVEANRLATACIFPNGFLDVPARISG